MKKNRSFTIVEIMVAMTIFALVIGGGIVLIQQTLVMISIANQRLKAYYLAQEAIELVRNVRDNNWLEQQNNNPSLLWTNGFPTDPFNWASPFNSQDFEIDYNDPYVPTPGNSSLTPVLSNGTSPASARYLSFDSSTGYSYNTFCTSPTSNPKCTVFQRWMRIAEQDGGIRIECHVKWKERGRTHEVIVKEKLHNWYGN